VRYLNEDAVDFQIASCQQHGGETGEYCHACQRYQVALCTLALARRDAGMWAVLTVQPDGVPRPR